MVKNIGILGSTGSIGTQTLEVVRELNLREESNDNPHINIVCLSAGSNFKLLAEQAREFNVKNICIDTEQGYFFLKEELKDLNPDIYIGEQGLRQISALKMDILVTAVVGMRGLIPTINAIKAGNNIALANKETLVAAGDIVMKLAKENNVDIFPVDSEHSAIKQCMDAGRKQDIKKIILTASGGPFRGWDKDRLKNVTIGQTLNHPTWKMGGKITVDSATLMNKGLEVIEAMHLFDIDAENIEVVVHPQSIIHSAVMYRDGSVIAQLGNPSMKTPIQYALTYPVRTDSHVKELSLTDIGKLTFEKPDTDTFTCLKLAFEAAKVKGTMPAVMNAANEVCVEAFMKGIIDFISIPRIIDEVMEKHDNLPYPCLEDILSSDIQARRMTGGLINGNSR